MENLTSADFAAVSVVCTYEYKGCYGKTLCINRKVHVRIEDHNGHEGYALDGDVRPCDCSKGEDVNDSTIKLITDALREMEKDGKNPTIPVVNWK